MNGSLMKLCTIIEAPQFILPWLDRFYEPDEIGLLLTLTKKWEPLESIQRRIHLDNAITINEGDRLLEVKLTNGNNHIIIAVESGRAIHFHESKVRPMGRIAAGVKGIYLDEDSGDKVVGMVCIEREDADLLVVSQQGFGKRSKVAEYRITNRGGKGVKTINVTEKTGLLVAIKEVTDTDDLMIINKSGITIRMEVINLRVMGRATQGVKLIRLNENDEISSVEVIHKLEDVEVSDDVKPEENNKKDDKSEQMEG